MLKPAILYKDKLIELFSKEIYTKEYYFYSGYPYYHELPTIEIQDNVFQWAVIDDTQSDDEILGYFAYRIDPHTDNVSNFGLYSFKRGSVKFGIEVFRKMEELIKNHHRIEWRMVEGNKVKRFYDKLVKRYNGYCVYLEDCSKNLEGAYCGEYIYEIVNREV